MDRMKTAIAVLNSTRSGFFLCSAFMCMKIPCDCSVPCQKVLSNVYNIHRFIINPETV